MVIKSYYLPEIHGFSYTARAPWPALSLDHQVDWIDNVQYMTQWLDSFVGPHWARWAWAQEQDQRTWECCVAFLKDKDRTLFLLKWA